MENHERKKVVGEKNKKNKTGLKKKERVPICQEKKKTSFVKATGAGGAPRWRSEFWIKKSPSNQNLPYTMLKSRFPFLYASTSLDAKTFVYKTLASNRNFESCMSIRCLASQHILQFFHFCRGCFLCIGNFAHHCVVLLNAPLSNRDKKKTCLHWISFPGKSWSKVSDTRESRCPIGLRFQEAR